MADLKLPEYGAALPKGKTVVVAILDGYGEAQFKDEWNAVRTRLKPLSADSPTHVCCALLGTTRYTLARAASEQASKCCDRD